MVRAVARQLVALAAVGEADRHRRGLLAEQAGEEARRRRAVQPRLQLHGVDHRELDPLAQARLQRHIEKAALDLAAMHHHHAPGERSQQLADDGAEVGRGFDLRVGDGVDRHRFGVQLRARAHHPVARGAGADAGGVHRHHADADDLVVRWIEAGGLDVDRHHRHVLERGIARHRAGGVEGPQARIAGRRGKLGEARRPVRHGRRATRPAARGRGGRILLQIPQMQHDPRLSSPARAGSGT